MGEKSDALCCVERVISVNARGEHLECNSPYGPGGHEGQITLHERHARRVPDQVQGATQWISLS